MKPRSKRSAKKLQKEVEDLQKQLRETQAVLKDALEERGLESFQARIKELEDENKLLKLRIQGMKATNFGILYGQRTPFESEVTRFHEAVQSRPYSAPMMEVDYSALERRVIRQLQTDATTRSSEEGEPDV